MGRPPKPPKFKTPLAAIIGENIIRRLPSAFPGRHNDTEMIGALASRVGMSPETIRRTAKGKTLPNLRQLEKIAGGLHCMAWELLRPFGMEPPKVSDGQDGGDGGRRKEPTFTPAEIEAILRREQK